MDATEARKIFVTDTSLLLHAPHSILSFKNNVVVIPFPVLEELDRHKQSGTNGTAAAARQAIRILDDLRKQGSLTEGVQTPDKGFVLVDGRTHIPKGLGIRLDLTLNDNLIIGVALRWQSRDEIVRDKKAEQSFFKKFGKLDGVTLVTKDINLRVKAAACNINADDYLSDRPVKKEEELYTGVAHIPVGSYLGEIGDRLNSTQGNEASRFTVDDAEQIVTLPELIPNQCCIFRYGDKTELALYKANGNGPDYFRHVARPKTERGKEIKPRNIEQAFAYALAMDKEIQIVTLTGIAGGGKTLMSLLAGVEQTASKNGKPYYEQVLVYRANTEIGTPLGFLKGNLAEKWDPWARPILDTLELVSAGREKEAFETKKDSVYNLEDMINGKDKKIQIQPINFVRGRSFHSKFVVVDETQNFTASDIKKVITRVGRGSKIILTGDIEQIDNLYLDEISNGLTHVVERMKGQPIFGHIKLEKSERSPLAEIAAKLL
jgi:PhoH-like ATPase